MLNSGINTLNSGSEGFQDLYRGIHDRGDVRYIGIVTVFGFLLTIVGLYMKYSHDESIRERNLRTIDTCEFQGFNKDITEFKMERQYLMLLENVLKHCESLINGKNPEFPEFHGDKKDLLRKGPSKDKDIRMSINVLINKHQKNLLGGMEYDRCKHEKFIFESTNIKELRLTDNILDSDVESMLRQINGIIDTLKLFIKDKKDGKAFDSVIDYMKDIRKNLEDRKRNIDNRAVDREDSEEIDTESVPVIDKDEQEKVYDLSFGIHGTPKCKRDSYRIKYKYIYLVGELITYYRLLIEGNESFPLKLYGNDKGLLSECTDSKRDKETNISRMNKINRVRERLKGFGNRGDKILLSIDKNNGDDMIDPYYEFNYLGYTENLKEANRNLESLEHQLNGVISLLKIFTNKAQWRSDLKIMQIIEIRSVEKIRKYIDQDIPLPIQQDNRISNNSNEKLDSSSRRKKLQDLSLKNEDILNSNEENEDNSKDNVFVTSDKIRRVNEMSNADDDTETTDALQY